jgi:hypothetical protein
LTLTETFCRPPRARYTDKVDVAKNCVFHRRKNSGARRFGIKLHEHRMCQNLYPTVSGPDSIGTRALDADLTAQISPGH